ASGSGDLRFPARDSTNVPQGGNPRFPLQCPLDRRSTPSCSSRTGSDLKNPMPPFVPQGVSESGCGGPVRTRSGPRLWCRFSQQRLQSIVAGAAHRELRAVGENGEAALFAIGFDAGYAGQVDDVRAVDTDELLRVKSGFERRDSLLLEVGF